MKNKHFYQIFKLKIKPWIKYWLIKQTEFKGVLSDILEGTSFYLTDSLNMKFKMFKIYGRTTQESTIGKNLWNNEQVTTTEIMEKLPTGFKITKSSSSRFGGTYLVNLPAEEYKFYGNIKTNAVGSASGFVIKYEDDTTSTIPYIRILDHATIAFLKNIVSIQPYINGSEDIGVYYEITDFMILSASETDTSYEPYTGGEPAPNPKYPMAIKNTGDNGSVNEKIQNKNLFDEDTVTFTVGVLDDNGNPTGSTASHYTNNFYQVTPNTNYTLKGTLNTGSSSGRIYYYDKDKKWISRSESFGSNQKNFTTPEKCYYIKIQVVVSITLKTGDVQLEQGSTASGYVPHSEQNISFPLAQGQNLMEGDYPDDDEKVHHVSGKMLFDGSSDENWIYNPTYAYFYITTSGFKSADFCDHYSKETGETLTNNHFRFNPNNGNLYIKDERFTSASSFKTGLATNNIILQGELAEETTEDFTEEQKTAWEEWKKARTYKGGTIISSEDETPAELKIQYWKEV